MMNFHMMVPFLAKISDGEKPFNPASLDDTVNGQWVKARANIKQITTEGR